MTLEIRPADHAVDARWRWVTVTVRYHRQHASLEGLVPAASLQELTP